MENVFRIVAQAEFAVKFSLWGLVAEGWMVPFS
jgi:hypothetical protein